MFTVDVKTVAEQTVLCRRRVVAIPELADHIRTSLDELRAEAQRCGGTVAGPGMTLYYSKVDDETDGEVQVCLPVDSLDRADRSRLSHDTDVDLLPGGTVAFTNAVGPDETRYPTILGAYDAVADWARNQGRVLSGPPREIAHADERLEVAWLLHDE